jgi:hypothetical protein
MPMGLHMEAGPISSVLAAFLTRRSEPRGAQRRNQADPTPRPGRVECAPEELALAVTCADVHPVPCEAILRGDTVDDVIDVAMRHGAFTHGFTPLYYDPAQRIKMLTTLQENCASD